MMYWVTHLLALMAGTAVGAVIMTVVQINHGESLDAAYWRGYNDRGAGRPGRDGDRSA